MEVRVGVIIGDMGLIQEERRLYRIWVNFSFPSAIQEPSWIEIEHLPVNRGRSTGLRAQFLLASFLCPGIWFFSLLSLAWISDPWCLTPRSVTFGHLDKVICELTESRGWIWNVVGAQQIFMTVEWTKSGYLINSCWTPYLSAPCLANVPKFDWCLIYAPYLTTSNSTRLI